MTCNLSKKTDIVKYEEKAINKKNSKIFEMNKALTKYVLKVTSDFQILSFVCHGSPLPVIITPPLTVFFSLFVPYLIANPNKLLPSESLAILIAFSHAPLPRR